MVAAIYSAISLAWIIAMTEKCLFAGSLTGGRNLCKLGRPNAGVQKCVIPKANWSDRFRQPWPSNAVIPITRGPGLG